MTSRTAATTRVDAVQARPHKIAFTVRRGDAAERIWVRSSLAAVPGADVAVALSLIPAMVAGDRLEVEAAVDESLAGRIPEIATVMRLFAATGDWTPARPIHGAIELACPTAPAPARRPDRGVASFFSGGVDSYATLARHPEITHLIYVAGLDLPPGAAFDSLHEAARASAGGVAAARDKTLITVETNVRDLYGQEIVGPLFFGSILGATSRLVAPEIARVYIPSSQAYRWMLENSSHPLLDHLWGGPGLEVVHDGAELTRPEKLELIADDELARNSLRVCWEGLVDSGGNCCRCEKCLRSMVALEVLGALEAFPAFERPLDLEAVADVRLRVRHEVAYWRENHELAVGRGAEAELIGAIESCLASADRRLRSAPRRGDLPNPREGDETMLYCDPRTWRELEQRDAVAFAVGSYDGSGNYGDIAQLQAAIELLDTLDPEPLVLPVLELGLVARHRELGLMASGGFDPGREVAFDASGEDADRAAAGLGLVPMALPGRVERVVTYLYGGGYLNETWGERKLTIAEAVEALADRAGIAAHPLVCSGLQIDPAWAHPGGTRKRRLFARARWIGVRDPLSLDAAAGLGDEAGEPPAMLTGDDAVGVIPRPSAEPARGAAAGPLTLNLHLCDQHWVTADAERQREFVVELIGAIAATANRPLECRPLIAYDDARISERPALERLLAELARSGAVARIREPIVLRPARLAAQAPMIAGAELTVGFSYHVALTSLMLGVPAALLRANRYYAQKADGLRRDFALPAGLTPAIDGDPAALAERLVALLGDPARADGLRAQVRAGAQRVAERRSRAEAELRADLGRALAPRPGAPPAPAPAERGGYATLMRIHAETVERADRLARLAAFQEARLADVERSASWRWTAPLRGLTARLRGRTPPT
jgi:polysaccharide pyruvyl transferase WcaK-like protein